MPPKTETPDPMERISKMISDQVEAAFKSRDTKAAEEKDPWAKLSGMVQRAVDEAVGRHFEELGKGLDEETEEKPGKILGGLFG